MPLVRISHRAGVTEAYRRALPDGVQEAMATTVKVPADDRFHILTEHASGLIFVMICLVENDLADWSFGNGEAQYVR